VVHKICINGILQVSALVVRKENVDGLGPGVAAIGAELGPGLGSNAVVDGMDDVLVGRKQRVGFDFFEGMGDGFLAEGTPDLLEGEEL
jgi:hypothetical protein